MSALHYWPIALLVVVPLGLYGLFLSLSAISFFQRHFLYAHKFHTLWWNDVNVPQAWGFAKSQVTPFTLTTVDSETIYAWHILPLPVYAEHEEELILQPLGLSRDIQHTPNFKLLKEDPNAKLINAGHVAQAIRPATYHTLTDTSSYHVLAIDYRGFGHSTGSPTEEGLITDASTAIDWALHVAGIPPSRIVLLGQSLGTAVTSGVAERYAHQGFDFAGVILVAGFSSLPTMLSDYAIAGWVPVLRPLKALPSGVLEYFFRFVVDKWESANRLREMVRAVKARDGILRLSLVHAKNDWDIPCHEDDKLFAAAVNGTIAGDEGMDPEVLKQEKEKRTVKKGEDAFTTTWRDGGVEITQELFPHGGHNDIITYAPVSLAVMRAFQSAVADGK